MPVRLRLTTLLLAVSALSACVASPASMVGLSRLSPLETNPADLRVAVRSTSEFDIRDGDLRMFFGFERNDGGTGVAERFNLDIDRTVGAAPGIPPIDPAQERIWITGLTPEDALRFRDAQARIKALRASGIDGTGTLSVQATGCTERDPRQVTISLTAYLQLAPDERFSRVLKVDDLNALLSEEGAQPLSRCIDTTGIDALADD